MSENYEFLFIEFYFKKGLFVLSGDNVDYV